MEFLHMMHVCNDVIKIGLFARERLHSSLTQTVCSRILAVKSVLNNTRDNGIYRHIKLMYNEGYYCLLDSERKGRYVELLFHGLEV